MCMNGYIYMYTMVNASFMTSYVYEWLYLHVHNG